MGIRNYREDILNIDENDALNQDALTSIRQRYVDVNFGEARVRFRREFFSKAKRRQFGLFAQDSTLNVEVEDDESCSTAYIDFGNGSVRIAKSIVLACLDNVDVNGVKFNPDLLNFILAHEFSHYKDLYNPDKRRTFVYGKTVERYIEWLEELNKRIFKKWDEVKGGFGDFYIDTDDTENGGTPLHSLYRGFMNHLEDTVVNEMAGSFDPNIDLSQIVSLYTNALFPDDDLRIGGTLRCVQFGYYLLNKRMTPDRELVVSEDVRQELDKKYHLYLGNKEGEFTLMELLDYLIYHRDVVYGVERNRRYMDYYLNAFERLLDLDIQQSQEMLKELLKKLMQNGGDGKNGGLFNGIEGAIQDAKVILDKARKEAKKARQEKVQTEEKKASPDSDSVDSMATEYINKVSSENSLDKDKTRRYFEILEGNREKIEKISDALVNILLRNKIEALHIDEKRKRNGDLNVEDVISNYAGIYAGNSDYLKVFDTRTIIDDFVKRSFRVKFRLVIDNSGSMSESLLMLEEAFVIINNALRLAEFKLINDYKQDAMLSTEAILFGNAKQENDENSGGRLIKNGDFIEADDDFHASLIEAFGKITTDEVTDDSDAWRLINNELFSPEEVLVKDTDEGLSVAIEITDGYTSNPSVTAKHLDMVLEKGVQAYCVMLKGDIALDVSLEDMLRRIEEEFGNEKMSDEELRDKKDEIIAQYNHDNSELLKTNPSAFWGERMKSASDSDEILQVFLLALMRATNEADKMLNREESYDLAYYDLKQNK